MANQNNYPLGANHVAYNRSEANAPAFSLARVLGDAPYIYQFAGVHDDGVTDSTAGINAALQSNAREIIFPADSITPQPLVISGALDVPGNMTLRGQNSWMARIVQTEMDEPIWRVNGAGDTRPVTIKDMFLDYDGTPVAGGNAIELTDAQGCLIDNLWINGGHNGLVIQSGVEGSSGNNRISNTDIRNSVQCGVLVSDSLGDRITAVKAYQANSYQASLGGFRLQGGVEGLLLLGCETQKGQYGLTTAGFSSPTTAPLSSPARDYSPWHNKIIGCYFDSPLKNPMYLRDCTDLEITATWLASAGYDDTALGYDALSPFAGMDMSQCRDVRIMGGGLYNNGGQGALVYADNKRVSFTDAYVARNGSTQATGDFAGLQFISGLKDFAVNGGTFVRNTDAGEPDIYRQVYSVDVSGASDRYFINNLIQDGCAIIDAGTGIQKVVQANWI